MTKQYIGNDTYKVFLGSGVELELSESEIQELSEDKVSSSAYNEVTDSIDQIEDLLSDLDTALYEFKDMDIPGESFKILYKTIQSITDDLNNEVSDAQKRINYTQISRWVFKYKT